MKASGGIRLGRIKTNSLSTYYVKQSARGISYTVNLEWSARLVGVMITCQGNNGL